MARTLLQQGPCRLSQGRHAFTRRHFLPCQRALLFVQSAARTPSATTQPVDVEQETCSSSRACCSSSPEALTRACSTDAARISGADSASCSGNSRELAHFKAAIALALASGLSLVLVDSAWASGGTLSGGAIDLFKEFLDKVESMGPAGGVVFVAVVMVSEMIPLFPTQPLSLASGLLFGGKEGAVLMLVGVTLAAVNAFFISRGVGRPLAEKVIRMEMGDPTSSSSTSSPTSTSSSSSAVARKLSEVTSVIERGSFWQQLAAVALLRLTPVVPFSASNYVLGLTPLGLPAFLAGTLAGMAVWSCVYASLGGAGRSLLEGGTDLGTVMAELAERSGTYTRPILLAASGVAAAAVLVYLVSRQLGG
ncbi:hypothetical protein Agub_g15939, partial [Astrephomene gubernaculifera]